LREYGLGCISISPTLLAQVARGLGFESIEQFPLKLECDDIRLLAQMIAESDVIGVLPLGTPAGPGEALRALGGTMGRALFADVHALWLTGRSLSPAARVALAAVRAEVAEVVVRSR
jgi:DNA-binding transcriptional LysR family regulator